MALSMGLGRSEVDAFGPVIAGFGGRRWSGQRQRLHCWFESSASSCEYRRSACERGALSCEDGASSYVYRRSSDAD